MSGSSARRSAASGKRSMQRSSVPSSRKNTAAQKQKNARMRKKRKNLVIAVAALIAVIAVALIILISSLTVPAPSELQIETSVSTQILSWKGNPKRLSYQIFRREGESDFELLSTIPLEGECSYVSSNLNSATFYEYKVIAVKGNGENTKESEGQTASAYTLPEAPANGSAVTLSKDSLTVSFTDSQPVSGYEVSYGTTENPADASALSLSPSELETDPQTGQLSFQIPNLTVGTTYYFAIRSFCGENVYSEWSSTFSGTVTQAVDMTGIDIHKPMVALTFDDGPDSGEFTYRILDVLKANGAHASFFQLGQLAENYPEVVKRIVDEGHELGCHTYDHSHMGNAVTADDIIRGNDALEKTSGTRPIAFRAPGGAMTDQIREICREQGQAIYHWSVDTRDWQSRDAAAVMSEVETQGVQDGDIILLHNIYESSAAATEQLVPWLINQGFQVVSASQLIQAKTGKPPVPGTQYFSATNFN